MTQPVVVAVAPVADTLALREATLRQGRDPVFDLDEHPDTLHLAARDDGGAGAVVGIVRGHPAPCPWRPEARAPWQLRGMATAPEARGSGVGRLLVDALLAELRPRGADLLWCNARLAAIGFYERLGFVVVSGEFEEPGVGPHRGMVLESL